MFNCRYSYFEEGLGLAFFTFIISSEEKKNNLCSPSSSQCVWLGNYYNVRIFIRASVLMWD